MVGAVAFIITIVNGEISINIKLRYIFSCEIYSIILYACMHEGYRLIWSII